MTTEHPITPPPELFAELLAEAKRLHPDESLGFISGQIAQLAYRAGADMELEACCEWLASETPEPYINALRLARRPKPPSLKEQSIALIDKIQYKKEMWQTDDLDVVRRALESLPD
jgi:proteasome lid subunit RPN8/RPN11